MEKHFYTLQIPNHLSENSPSKNWKQENVYIETFEEFQV